MIKNSPLFQRPHLLWAILIALIAILFLTLAAGKILRDDKEESAPLPQPVIATEVDPSQQKDPDK